MIRVAALLDAPGVAGPARQLTALARALGGQDVEMTLILFHRQGRSPDASFLAALERDAIPHRVLQERRRGDFGVVTQLEATLREIGADIVETHGYKPTTLAWLLRRRGVELPWIGFFHGATAENPKVHFFHWLDRQLMRRADRIVVMSREQSLIYSRHGPPVEVIYNAAIPLAEAASAATSGGFALPAGESGPTLGVIGRLSPEKGCDVFLRAAASLQGRGVAFRGVFVGDGPERKTLEALAAELQLSGRIHFAGRQEDMRPVYQALDLLVIPSRSEGLPNVLLEALQADLPVVATSVGAIPEVLEPAGSGVMVAPGNPEQLAGGIAHALENLRNPAWKAARQNVVKQFSFETRVQAHRTLYQSVLQRTDDEPVPAVGRTG